MNLHNKDDLMELLLKIEFSLYSPIANRKGKKNCPYCGRFEYHEHECSINNAILEMMAGVFTKETKEATHRALKEVEWCGWMNICPACENQKGEDHKKDCPMKGVSEL